MYQINLDEDALRFLRKLDKSERVKISKKLNKLKSNPELGKPLIGNMSGIRSLRVDKYRILYRIFKGKLIIFILNIGPRKNVYDN
ncbi:plasmid stabilization system protein [archaeon BMS3Abin17]|nr:plasmid stabilization system protein [archaeon BMS3Abin17]HDZ61207.1 type II toxin-antitoxin system RelE/ParE family toxin [Candidatus Pacearchaeota archaeon]